MQILNLPSVPHILDAMHMILSTKFVGMTSMWEFKRANLCRFWHHREVDPRVFLLFVTTSEIILHFSCLQQ